MCDDNLMWVNKHTSGNNFTLADLLISVVHFRVLLYVNTLTTVDQLTSVKGFLRIGLVSRYAEEIFCVQQPAEMSSAYLKTRPPLNNQCLYSHPA